MSGILIVDDEESVLTVLNRVLELLMPGYDISTATNGFTAWQQLQQHSFDLLLTDQHMPGMTGLELAQQVRDSSPELPIVLMSGGDESDIEAKAQKLGLVGFLSKPFSVHQLRDLLESILVPAQASKRWDVAEDEKINYLAARAKIIWYGWASFERRFSQPPGMHGRTFRSRSAEYGRQLREKQKVKRIFGMREKQFQRFFSLASKSRELTGVALLKLLERRLDNIGIMSNLSLSVIHAKTF